MTDAADPERLAALRTARAIAAALVAGPPVLMLLPLVAPLDADLSRLVAPVVLIGIVNPLLAYRVYLSQREGKPASGAGKGPAERFVRATVLALGVSELVALLAVIGYWLTSRPVTLLGLATHFLAAGAIWPTEERLEAFESRE
jgi:hypothetical protein